MKALIVFSLLMASGIANANLCSQYNTESEKYQAVKVVAGLRGSDVEALCEHERLMSIEAQLSQVISPEEGIIPHIDVYLNFYSESCRYQLRRSNLTLTKVRCFSNE